MLTQEQLQHYEEHGYIILENMFAAAEIDALRERLDRYDEENEKRLAAVGQEGISIAKKIVFTSKINLIDPHVRKFACGDTFARLTTDILGPDTQLYWDQTVYKKPEADRDFPWHQDNGYVPTEPEHYLTCWLALEDATVENGCIWIQPGSHKMGFLEHKNTDIGKQCYFGDDPGTPVPLRKGSMVAFHSLLLHRSTPNLSDTVRKAYVLQYSQAGARNPVTGVIFENGPVIAREGKHVYVSEV